VHEFLLAAAAVILATVAVGLVRVLRGPGNAERMMAAQLIGSGGIAALLMAGVATDVSAATDLALTLALLATFASIAFVKKGTARSPDVAEAPEG
jgi:multicomponent Na+:H+ antiporter subunit F